MPEYRVTISAKASRSPLVARATISLVVTMVLAFVAYRMLRE